MLSIGFLRRLAAATGGASAVEFAVITAALLLPLTIGVYDFGTALHRWMEVGNAARAGAQFINVNGYSSTYTTTGHTCPNASTNSFTCAVQQATNLGNAVTASVGSAYCGCQNGSTYTAQNYSPPCNSCGASITSKCCPSPQTPVTMAQVTATYNYAPLFSYFGIGPSNGLNITAQSTALLY
ncbi:MAG TPA: TadE/TadG family type IV pilus assembly protein [Stellaceae bacterium]|nr:TadE/TadG family type IV pilus assembly protein [Stellaceae bacterium]